MNRREGRRGRVVRTVIRLGVILALSWPLAAVADPITYEVHRTLSMIFVEPGGFCADQGTPGLMVPPPCPSYTLSGTITTDGTLGPWGFEDHIIGLALTLSDGGSRSVALTEHQFFGAVATETELTRAPGPPGAILSGIGAGWNSCGRNVGSTCYEAMVFSDAPGIFMFNQNSTIGVVPEPGTALLVALGLILLGGAGARIR